jgi:hypothetical protein
MKNDIRNLRKEVKLCNKEISELPKSGVFVHKKWITMFDEELEIPLPPEGPLRDLYLDTSGAVTVEFRVNTGSCTDEPFLYLRGTSVLSKVQLSRPVLPPHRLLVDPRSRLWLLG